MQWIVPADRARELHLGAGVTKTLINAGATDVYYDADPNRLNATVAGVPPNGTLLANTNGFIQISSPGGASLWFRAATETTIEVQP